MRSVRKSESAARPGRAPRQKRAPLTVDEILQLEAALMEVFRTIRQLRARTNAARHIKLPPVPSVFSESIAVATTPVLFGSGWKGRYGGHQADLIVENLSTRRSLKVEVKATGQHAFQELKLKDLQADVLIWFRFGRRFESGTGPIEVAVLDSPGRYVRTQCRLDVRRFEAIPGVQHAQKILRFESLAVMLAEADARFPAGRSSRPSG
jgi:hypothetical protein